MNAEDRLARAFGSSLAPPRDPAFSWTVMKAVEQARFQHQALVAALRAGALGALSAFAALSALDWIVANRAALLDAGLAVGVVVTLFWATRLSARRFQAPARSS